MTNLEIIKFSRMTLLYGIVPMNPLSKNLAHKSAYFTHVMLCNINLDSHFYTFTKAEYSGLFYALWFPSFLQTNTEVHGVPQTTFTCHSVLTIKLYS